jgi:L,D-transpeptidase catalytic domain
MPHSIFFHGGYAIHGTYEINRLGGPASHGCIRLHPANAAALFALVKREGMAATTIVISRTNPVVASGPHHRHGLTAEGTLTNATGVVTDGRDLRMKVATDLTMDGRGLLMATPIGLTTDCPIITGVHSRERFHPSILTERRRRLIRVRPSSALSFS